MHISLWVASQRPAFLSTVLTTQATSLVWDLISCLEEYSALVGKKTLETMYNYATSKLDGFLMVDLMKPLEETFFANLNKGLIPTAQAADASANA